MNTSKHQRDKLLALCGQLHDDDGVDSRRFFGNAGNQDKQDRKPQQLCSQIRHTIALVLSGDFGDEMLHNLQVVQVTPAPDSTRVLVTLTTDAGPQPAMADDILRRLAGYTPAAQ